jgi:threonine synthase
LDAVPVLPAPASVAVSIADPTSGKPALDAIRESGGEAIVVGDEEILEAQRHLAAHGMLVEATSAVTVAGVADGVRTGLLRRGDRIVCVLTGAGVKWSAQLTAQVSSRVFLEPSVRSMQQLARRAQQEPQDRPVWT